MADTVKKSSMNTTGERAATAVTFGADTKVPEARKPTAASQNYVVEVTIPPPVGLHLKDEVELLRGGYKDKEGHQLKSQAATAKPTPTKATKAASKEENGCDGGENKAAPKGKKKKDGTVEIDL